MLLGAVVHPVGCRLYRTCACMIAIPPHLPLAGAVCILGIDHGLVLHYCHNHNISIKQLMFTHDGRWFVSVSTNALCISDAQHHYDVMKVCGSSHMCPFLNQWTNGMQVWR